MNKYCCSAVPLSVVGAICFERKFLACRLENIHIYPAIALLLILIWRLACSAGAPVSMQRSKPTEFHQSDGLHSSSVMVSSAHVWVVITGISPCFYSMYASLRRGYTGSNVVYTPYHRHIYLTLGALNTVVRSLQLSMWTITFRSRPTKIIAFARACINA